MRYTETLKQNDRVWVWMGDVRYTETVSRIDGRYIYTNRGRFGKKTGKGIDEPHMHLANKAGEREVN